MSVVESNHENDIEWQRFYHSYLELHNRRCHICDRKEIEIRGYIR